MNTEILKLTAQKMVTKGKGILAADESTPTCTKRFQSIGLKSTNESRNKYRDMLFTTNELEKYITKGNRILRYGCQNVTRFRVFQDGILKLSGYAEKMPKLYIVFFSIFSLVPHWKP